MCGNVMAMLWQCMAMLCANEGWARCGTLFNDCPRQLANTSLSPHHRIGADISMMTMLRAKITKGRQNAANYQLTTFEQPAQSILAASLVLEKVKIMKSKAGAKENGDCCSYSR